MQGISEINGSILIVRRCMFKVLLSKLNLQLHLFYIQGILKNKNRERKFRHQIHIKESCILLENIASNAKNTTGSFNTDLLKLQNHVVF